MARIENVFAVTEGAEEPDRYVILGNHRDAWTFGAADPNRGTAAMIEIGSTEWVEENREMLSLRAIAYLNVDVSVVGPVFQASTTPQLDELLLGTIKLLEVSTAKGNHHEEGSLSGQRVNRLPPARQRSPKQSMKDDADEGTTAGRREGGVRKSKATCRSRAALSQNSSATEAGPEGTIAGSNGEAVRTVDVEAAAASTGADRGAAQAVGVAPPAGARPGTGGGGELSDHTAFVEHVGIPSTGMVFGEAASIWGIMALRLADEDIIPFDYMSYTVELEDIQRELSSKQLGRNWLKIRGLNDRLMQAERAFTNREGLFKQSWYKHLICGPSAQNDWDTAYYPGIANAIATTRSTNTAASWKQVQHEIHRVARAVTKASAVLAGSLT
ncbi:hypothetical protein BRADI_2g49361v3 [Brachypodium distachyon]|uniref:Transferrin receptor-like dimerisation domain-containing protein n=1 Tax=Brachypodium distachyon TaxID=15368 RepID=A0A2K2DEZ0_BRADI|nr:hypothetical protein BRADI_2g49361v3 [Brachypodium distachyon]